MASRRALLLSLLLLPAAAARAEGPRDFAGWFARQRAREEAEQARNRRRERNSLQHEHWERQRAWRTGIGSWPR